MFLQRGRKYSSFWNWLPQQNDSSSLASLHRFRNTFLFVCSLLFSASTNHVLVFDFCIFYFVMFSSCDFYNMRKSLYRTTKFGECTRIKHLRFKYPPYKPPISPFLVFLFRRPVVPQNLAGSFASPLNLSHNLWKTDCIG